MAQQGGLVGRAAEVDTLVDDLFCELGLNDADAWAEVRVGRLNRHSAVASAVGPVKMRSLLCTRGLRYPQVKRPGIGDCSIS